MAKLNWAASYLCLDFSEKDSRNAAEIGPDTRNYLQTLKFRAMTELVQTDMADLSRDNMLLIAGHQARIKLLDELLAFFTIPVSDDTLSID